MRKMIALLATVALMLFGGAATALAASHAPPQNPPCDAGTAGEHNPNCDEQGIFTPGTPGQGDQDDAAVEEHLTDDDGADADAGVEGDVTEDEAADADAGVEGDVTEDEAADAGAGVEGDVTEDEAADAGAGVEGDVTDAGAVADDAVAGDGVVEEDAGEDGAGFVADLLAGLTALFGSRAA